MKELKEAIRSCLDGIVPLADYVDKYHDIEVERRLKRINEELSKLSDILLKRVEKWRKTKYGSI